MTRSRYFSSRMQAVSTEEWLAESGDNSPRHPAGGAPGSPPLARKPSLLEAGSPSLESVAEDDRSHGTIIGGRVIESPCLGNCMHSGSMGGPHSVPDEDDVQLQLEEENEELQDEVERVLQEIIELRRQLTEKEAAEQERRRQEEEAKFLATRTRMQMQAQQQHARSGVAGNGDAAILSCFAGSACSSRYLSADRHARCLVHAAVLVNPLFANAGSARRIGFAIDISGSMRTTTDGGAVSGWI
jgi:hypothetical protein